MTFGENSECPARSCSQRFVNSWQARAGARLSRSDSPLVESFQCHAHCMTNSGAGTESTPKFDVARQGNAFWHGWVRPFQALANASFVTGTVLWASPFGGGNDFRGGPGLSAPRKSSRKARKQACVAIREFVDLVRVCTARGPTRCMRWRRNRTRSWSRTILECPYRHFSRAVSYLASRGGHWPIRSFEVLLEFPEAIFSPWTRALVTAY